MAPLYYLSSSLVLRLQKEFHMFFSIDANNGVAIYEQIVRQVKFAIAEESLRPGQLLPSVRTLSVQLALNPNTIARAYQQLQSDGVLESLRGRGLAVCQGATKACREERRSIIADRLQSVLTEALHGGLTAPEIEDIVRKQLKKLTPTVNTVSSTVPSQPTA
jgi:GntR family transcriptional regulator